VSLVVELLRVDLAEVAVILVEEALLEAILVVTVEFLRVVLDVIQHLLLLQGLRLVERQFLVLRHS